MSAFLRWLQGQTGIKIFVYTTYAFVFRLVYLLVNILPYVLSWFFYKAVFRKMGRHVLIDYGCQFRYPGKMTLGDSVSVNQNCRFFCSFMAEQGTITIGSHVAIAPEVCIFAAGHDYHYLDLPDIAAPVVIEDYVWIGGRSIILPGVTIGRGSIIGAGSVVSRSVPPFSVVAGNPAQVIKKRIIVEPIKQGVSTGDGES